MYTMTIGDDCLNLETCHVEEVHDLLEKHDLLDRMKHYRSPLITYTGDFGKLDCFAPITGNRSSENTEPPTPYDAWVVAQIVTLDYGSPVDAWFKCQQISPLTMKDANKMVDSVKFCGVDGLHYHEYNGDLNHFHEYIAEDASAVMEQDEDCTDAEFGLKYIREYCQESMFYTDGGMVYELTPY